MIWIKMQKSRRGRRPHYNTALFKVCANVYLFTFSLFKKTKERQFWRGAICISLRITLEKVLSFMWLVHRI